MSLKRCGLFVSDAKHIVSQSFDKFFNNPHYDVTTITTDNGNGDTYKMWQTEDPEWELNDIQYCRARAAFKEFIHSKTETKNYTFVWLVLDENNHVMEMVCRGEYHPKKLPDGQATEGFEKLCLNSLEYYLESLDKGEIEEN